MNEEQFRAELYRHLVNEIEKNDINLKVKVEESCLIQKTGKIREAPRADITVYEEDYARPTLIVETKLEEDQVLGAVTQVYRYGFYFCLVGDRFVAVCTPNILRLYRYDSELGSMAHKTPKDVEGGKYVGENGETFSWQVESERRLMEEYRFPDNFISDIAQEILNFVVEHSRTGNED